MIAFAKEQECPIQVATYMFPPLRRDSTLVGCNDRLSPEEAGLAKVTADYLQGEPEWFVAVASQYRAFIPLEHKPWEQGVPHEEGMRCRAGLCSLWVDWQGNFSNCGMYPSVTAIHDERTFLQKWEQVVQDTAEIRYAAACFHCPNRPLCHTCIAMVYNECGSHSGRPEYLCRMTEAVSRCYDQFLRKYYPDVSPIFGIAQEPSDTCEI